MREYVEATASPRKLRLFACACCRRVWHLMADNRVRRAVEVAEVFADGGLGEAELCDASRDAAATWGQYVKKDGPAAYAAFAGTFAADQEVRLLYDDASSSAVHAVWARAGSTGPADRAEEEADRERRMQAALFRDIFGNPFRPVVFHPRWRTSDALGLARAIYDEGCSTGCPSWPTP